jgi:hypothetical protein
VRWRSGGYPPPECVHFIVGHELPASGLLQSFLDGRALFVIHNVDTFTARLDFPGKLGEFLSAFL